MENKNIRLAAVVILGILISITRHFVDNETIEIIVMTICLILTFWCLRKDMNKITSVAIKGLALSFVIILIAAILAYLRVISLFALAVIVCISISLSIILVVIQWVVTIKNMYNNYK